MQDEGPAAGADRPARVAAARRADAPDERVPDRGGRRGRRLRRGREGHGERDRGRRRAAGRHQPRRARPRRHRPPRLGAGALEGRARALPPGRGRAGRGIRRARLLAHGAAPDRDPPAAPLHAPLHLGRRPREDLRDGRRGGADRGLRGDRARRPRARADRALAGVRRRRAGQRHRLPDDDDAAGRRPPTSRTRPTTWTRTPRARASAGWRRCGRGSSPSATSGP